MSLFETPIQITREDDTQLPGIRLMPDDAAAERCQGAGVVVMCGEHGLGEPELARLARPLAEAGYQVVAFSVVEGPAIDDDAAAARRAQAVVPERAIADLVGALRAVKQMASGKLGVVGTGVAAPIALEAATCVPLLDAVVHLDGPAPPPTLRLGRVRAGLQIHRAGRGTQLPAEAAGALVARAQRAGVFVWDVEHPAHDGFAVRPRDDDEALHGRLAGDQLRDFLAQQLT